MSTKKLRENWLNRASLLLVKQIMEPAKVPPMPEKWAVSVGWPGGGRIKSRIGECWSPQVSAGDVTEMFISPILGDPITVLATLLHELIHAAVGVKHKHEKPFSKPARACGLEGKITATVPGEALKVKLQAILNKIGPYPHSEMSPGLGTTKAKSAPWPTFHCTSDDKYRVQIRPEALEAFGPPISPINGEEMIRATGTMKRK